jgi:hypothetical protein
MKRFRISLGSAIALIVVISLVMALIAQTWRETCLMRGHKFLMIGPPGTGKTLLAKRLPTILPPLTPAESLETTRIYSDRNNLLHYSNRLGQLTGSAKSLALVREPADPLRR